jgi:NTE family protein
MVHRLRHSLRPRIHEDAALREADLVQLTQIASTYPSRERFLTELTLDPPDVLARPVPDKPTVSELARGLDRTLVLGGGGDYYVAWYCGFLHGLYEQKVDLNIAEMIVGTSAGATNS